MSSGREGTGVAQGQASGRGRFRLALLVLLSVCAVAIWRSALFRLEQLEVSGLNRLTEQRIMEAAGLRPGALKWEHAADAVVERLLREEPWVKAATAQWLTGSLAITIQEREPVGLVRHSDLYYLALDAEGVVLEQVNLLEGYGLPVISGVASVPVLRGDRLDQAPLRDALDMLGLFYLTDPLFLGQISEVHVGSDRSLTLYMQGGTTVLWGQLPEGRDRTYTLQEKGATLFGFWKTVPAAKRSQCRIDLRVVPKAAPSAQGCE